jgi:hypothetical protein
MLEIQMLCFLLLNLIGVPLEWSELSLLFYFKITNETPRFKFVIKSDQSNPSYIQFYPVSFTGSQAEFR